MKFQRAKNIQKNILRKLDRRAFSVIITYYKPIVIRMVLANEDQWHRIESFILALSINGYLTYYTNISADNCKKKTHRLQINYASIIALSICLKVNSWFAPY